MTQFDIASIQLDRFQVYVAFESTYALAVGKSVEEILAKKQWEISTTSVVFVWAEDGASESKRILHTRHVNVFDREPPAPIKQGGGRVNHNSVDFLEAKGKIHTNNQTVPADNDGQAPYVVQTARSSGVFHPFKSVLADGQLIRTGRAYHIDPVEALEQRYKLVAVSEYSNFLAARWETELPEQVLRWEIVFKDGYPVQSDIIHVAAGHDPHLGSRTKTQWKRVSNDLKVPVRLLAFFEHATGAMRGEVNASLSWDFNEAVDDRLFETGTLGQLRPSDFLRQKHADGRQNDRSNPQR